eukprot:scaffold75270_cov59-Cyclotella_meneghiniana.AAC.1
MVRQGGKKGWVGLHTLFTSRLSEFGLIEALHTSSPRILLFTPRLSEFGLWTDSSTSHQLDLSDVQSLDEKRLGWDGLRTLFTSRLSIERRKGWVGLHALFTSRLSEF